MTQNYQLRKLYIVKKRIDFWKEDESVRRYFVDKAKADIYLEQLSEHEVKIPTIVYIETSLCIHEQGNTEKVYLLKSTQTPVENEIFIEFHG